MKMRVALKPGVRWNASYVRKPATLALRVGTGLGAKIEQAEKSNEKRAEPGMIFQTRPSSQSVPSDREEKRRLTQGSYQMERRWPLYRSREERGRI
jgi:hypothetical protein